jgi:hypothetical protein
MAGGGGGGEVAKNFTTEKHGGIRLRETPWLKILISFVSSI